MNTTPTKPTPAAPAAVPTVPRRHADIPGQRRAVGGDAPASGSDAGRMFVGRDITLSGEIGSCDVLLVEGAVEVKLRESRHLEVTESGVFKGAAEVHDADISGRFEGELVVHGRLRVRASGRIEGRIQYGELEVESGGQLIGDILMSAPAASGRPVPAVADTTRLAGFPSVPPASAASRAAGQQPAQAPEPEPAA